jgi:hypothetical protein
MPTAIYRQAMCDPATRTTARGTLRRTRSACKQNTLQNNTTTTRRSSCAKDVHLAYADALEHKLKGQKEKDPNLFIAAVREWLIVLRNEKGDERGITNGAGLAIPGLQHMYRDEERSVPALQHIVALVGYPPRMHETDHMFLKKVAKQCEASVKGTVMKGSK